MVKPKKEDKGITLVALIITIIILLILAGITIAQLTGNGLFEKAQLAVDKTKYANAAEKVALAVNASYNENGKLNDNMLKENLNNIDGINPKITEVTYNLSIIVYGYEFLISKYGQITAVGRNEGLPENTPETEAGTEVALKDGWGTETVYAVSDGQGNNIPIPYGFYYVGGNLDTGVIISDSEADKYDGVTDKTTWEYTTSLVENQFVWIPCGENEYVKTNWGTTYQNGNWETTTERGEMVQIQKYGGFYVGRYEAELADITTSSTWENYGNTQISYKGRLAKAYYSSAWYLPAFKEETEGTTSIYNSANYAMCEYGDLLTTGASNQTEVYHIYDIAGNVWEWTEENSTYATSDQYRMHRGGASTNIYTTYPACYRLGVSKVNYTNFNLGFRTVLYIK